MKPRTSPIRRAVVRIVMPTVATLLGVQVGCLQPEARFSAQATLAPSPVFTDVSLLITVGPPPIPIYEQPACPDPGYLWTPGYWAWSNEGYFWVPGTWVMAPVVGLLWTPGYWAWGGESYVFHSGYWGFHVGFYGGINYGHGYGGTGFEGGYWQGQNYAYNRAVTNVNITRITNVYNKTVIIDNSTHVAYNGGEGGVRATPTQQEQAMVNERHVPLTTEQAQHHQRASQNKELLVAVNHGKPPVAATVKPANFSPENVVPARAPGGPVPEATLNATPKTLPPPPKGRAVEAKPPQTGVEAKPPSPPPPPEPQASTPPRQAPGPVVVAPSGQPAPVQPPPPAPSNQGKTQPHQVPGPTVAPAEQPTPKPRPGPAPNPKLKRKPGPSQPTDPSNPNYPYLWPPPQGKPREK